MHFEKFVMSKIKHYKQSFWRLNLTSQQRTPCNLKSLLINLGILKVFFPQQDEDKWVLFNVKSEEWKCQNYFRKQIHPTSIKLDLVLSVGLFPVKYNSTIWLDKGQRPISLPYKVSLINVATSLSFPNKSSFKYTLSTYFGSVTNFIQVSLIYKISYLYAQFLYKIIYLWVTKLGPVVIMNPLVLSLSLGVRVTIQSLYTVNQNGEFNSKIIGEKKSLLIF